MALDQEYLYMLYFYIAVIEYIYFVILYIEGFGNTSLNTLCKHVKFFKVEVSIFILSFHGKTFEDKLYQMLNTVGYFKIFQNKIYINGNKPFKDAILNDLVISKCADLVLRGIDNIDAITESLNFNNVIYISKKNILDIIEKSSYFCTKNKQIVSMLNVHGLLGFEDKVSNSVISYFHGVLYRTKVLSYKQVKEDHSRFLTFCGIHNIMMIFSILNSSKSFDCKNGYVQLKKKSRKYPKLKTINLDLQEARFSSRSMTVGQIVQSVYGSSLYKWTGEIGSLNEYSGMIYCVVKFSNNSDGVFNVCFNEASLKMISDTKNLKMYLKIRDAVEFDAKYYIGKNSERCWRASRLKVLHNNKFEHDEILYDKLCPESELLKNQCFNNGYCIINSNLIWEKLIYDNCKKIKNPKYNCKEKLKPKIMKTTANKFQDTNDSINKLDATCKNDNKNGVSNQKPSYDFSFSSLSIIEYSYVFGYIYMLMADKGMAIVEQGGEIFNIVFTKNSVYTPDRFENFINGQKIVALIPYHRTLDSFCVSTLVHGLSKNETYETEKNNVLPKDFAVKIFANSVTQKLQCKFCNKRNDLHKFLSKKEGCFTTFKQRNELIKLYVSILKEYKVPVQNDYLSQLLFGLYKMDRENLIKKEFDFLIKMSMLLNKYDDRKAKRKCPKKMKMVKNSVNNHNLQTEAQMNDVSTSGSQMSLIDENNVSEEYSLAKESNSLDTAAQPNRETSSSFEMSNSSDSTESFYSCESSFNSLNTSSSSVIHQQDVSQDLDDKRKINLKLVQEKKFETVSNKKISHVVSESNQEFRMKRRVMNLKQRLQFKKRSKYLTLKAALYLKYSVNKKTKIVLPSILKSACENCIKSTVNLAAYISMISTSFFFYTLNINGCSVTLPLLKEVVPPDLQGNMKLNSYSELTVIPNVLANLSHIIVVNTLT